jgi:aminoglycoside/choline kinase family phosphotransferase
MLPELVKEFTRARFPDAREASLQVERLEKGGSGRVYYRVQMGEESVIFAKYTDQREENRHFVDIAYFLDEAGVQVPRIYHHDSGEGLIWMQDLGREDLWSFRDGDWALRRTLYASALRQAARLHGSATRSLKLRSRQVKLQIEFNETLYLWEQEYFFENCVRGIFGVDDRRTQELASSPALHNLARMLATLPRCLVHRDFQSQNILIHEGTAWLIDFQGLRPGLPQYDVASLLYDPYTAIDEEERQELLVIYREEAVREGVEFSGDFEEIFLGCAAQRLMQALGAYGFLGLKAGHPGFLRHVPSARRSLRDVMARLDGLHNFVDLLDSSA